MTQYTTPRTEYTIAARRITGTREERLDQIEAAIQELLDVKRLECAAGWPSLRFIAAPKPRSHALMMIATILALLIILVLLLGVRPAHAQATAAEPPPAQPAAATSEPIWSDVTVGAINTAASFTTNTNWQAYSGETTTSYMTQMAGLAYHNFVSAACRRSSTPSVPRPATTGRPSAA